MKRKMALLMAMVFCLMCCFSSFAFAEDDAVIAEETVIEEATEEIAEEPAEETVDEPAETPAEEIPAEDTAEESAEEAADEEIIEEEAPAEATPDSEEDEMILNAIDSDVQDVAEAITEEMLTSDREPAYAVTKNLDMSLRGDIDLPDGVTVTFASDNEDVIANDGTVSRVIGSDTDVKVIATVSKDGSEDAVKELNFKVLNMETALLYANNYYYPEHLDTEFISYGNSLISDFAYENANSGNVSTYIRSYEDGYGVNVKRLTGGGVCYLDSFTNVNAPEQKKMTFRTTLNINDWGSTVKRLDIEIFGKTTKDVSMGKVEINNATGAIYVVATAGSDFTNTYISKRLNLNQDYKIEFVVDYENHKFEFLIDGVNYFADKEFKFLTSFKPAISKTNYYFFRQATGATFTLKDTVVTGEFDLSDPQVALDMIDESCFTYTNPGKLIDGFSFVVPKNAKTLAELYNMDITVSSSKPSALSFDGYNATVTKAEEKQPVEITVTVATAEKSVSKTFDVTVHNLAAMHMFDFAEPVFTENGGNRDVSVDVYCDNLKEGESSGTVYLFAVRKEKGSGKIDAVDVDTYTFGIGDEYTLTASLPDGGDDYDYVAYLWDSFEGQKTMINQPPAEPAEVEVTGTTAGSADLSWTKADDDRKAVSYYNIYRDGNLVGSSQTTDYTGENLDFGNTYTFGVTTVDDSGLESEYMAETVATTTDIPTITYVSKDPVEAPNQLQHNSDNLQGQWMGQNTYLWTRPTVADGLMCHETTLYDRVNSDDTITKIHSFFHTKTPFTYIDGDTKNIVIEITYFDEKPAENKGTETISVAYQGGSQATQFKDTGFWRTAVFDITNAKFTEAALNNAGKLYNVRFNSTTVGLKVHKTSIVKTEEYVRPTASLKMVDGALVLRDILVYKKDGQISYDEAAGEKCFKLESGNILEMDVERLASNQNDVCVEVTYFDEGDGNIVVEYNGGEGVSIDSIRREDSGTWKTALFTLDGAILDGSLSSNFGRTVDLKLFGDGDTKIKSVRVYR